VEQFFIRLDEIRGKALDAIHHQIKWVPSWGENRIAGTVESRPDWVISRQRSWGVPLPVFYVEERATLNADWIRRLADLVAQRGSNVWFELSDAELTRELELPKGTTKRNDTIDVWIDSGVSHRAVCATRPELRDPADMYLEATDQHRGWFQSSLMTSIVLNDRAPYTKPVAALYERRNQDAEDRRSQTAATKNADLSSRRGEDEGEGFLGRATLIDHWILDRLDHVIAECRNAYATFEFHKVYHSIN